MQSQDNWLEDETGLYFLRNGIIHCIYHKDTILDLITIKKVIKNRNIIAEGMPRPLLIDAQGVVYWTREAKHYTWVNKETMLFITAIAPVVNKLALKISIDWTIHFFPPAVPVKTFSEIDPALKWLEEFKARHSIKDLVKK
jgi:hypothetical protein